MSFQLPTTLNPFEGRLQHETLVLRTLRLALIVCIGLLPVYGLVMAHAAPGFIDPWWIRGMLTGIAVALLIATYTSEWVRSRSTGLFTVFLTGLLFWFGGLTVVNHLSPAAAVGFVFVYFSVGTMLGLVSKTVGAITLYTALGAASGLAIVVAVAEPLFDPALFALTTTSTGLVYFIGTYARIRDRSELAEREWTLASAEALGEIGSWSFDIATGDRRWSDGMYRLMGMLCREGAPPTVFEHTPAEMQADITEYERRLLAGEVDTVDHRHQIVRPDGTRREVRSIVQVLQGENGAPRRLSGVVIDITMLAEHERELEVARREAEAAAALKSAILANMSHEIRTPLTAVLGYAQLLREDAPPDLLDLVTPIEIGGQRLLETLNAVLDYAQLEAGSTSLAHERIDVTALALSIAEAAREPAEASGLVLNVDVPEAPVWITADRDALGRSLAHLVSNAIKFTDFGAATLSVGTTEGLAEIRVMDTGCGIAAEFVPQLFEAFQQESTGTSRKHEGSGLGLAVTHRLVLAMGGTIEAESEPGQGTTFTIRLALATDPVPPPDGSAWIARGRADRNAAPATALASTAA